MRHVLVHAPECPNTVRRGGITREVSTTWVSRTVVLPSNGTSGRGMNRNALKFSDVIYDG